MKDQENKTLSRREILKTVFSALAVSGITAITADAQAAGTVKLDIVNQFSPLNGRRPARPQTRYIILHTTEGGDAGSLNKLVRFGEAHYFVARSGRVTRIIDRNKIARHAGRSMWEGRRTLDDHSLGVEVSGFHNRDITAAQYEAVRELLRQLKSLYKITDDRVLPHSMVAYGIPNRFHKENHRGRKRCGMLFADLNVRARLGLNAAPNRDPDVAARRLIVADKELYDYLLSAGRTGASLVALNAKPSTQAKPSAAPPVEIAEVIEPADAMEADDAIEIAATIENGTATEIAAATEVTAAPKAADAPKTASAPKIAAASKTATAASKPALKPAPKTGQPVISSESQVITLSRTAWQIARERYNSASTIYEFPDGRRLNGNQVRDWGHIPTGTRVILAENHEPESGFDGFLEIGRDGDTPQALAGSAYARATTIYFFPNGLIRTGAELQRQSRYRSLFRNPPTGTRLLVGYIYGGRVTNNRRPSRIAGIRWNYPSTYYRYPDGRIMSGDDVNDRSIPTGTLVFFQE
jgi:hypothetical protein